MGGERVLFISAVSWSLITAGTPLLASLGSHTLALMTLTRFLMGFLQGEHCTNYWSLHDHRLLTGTEWSCSALWCLPTWLSFHKLARINQQVSLIYIYVKKNTKHWPGSVQQFCSPSYPDWRTIHMSVLDNLVRLLSTFYQWIHWFAVWNSALNLLLILGDFSIHVCWPGDPLGSHF